MLLERIVKRTVLTPTQQEVLAAVFAYDSRGQRSFQEERISRADWKKALSELEHIGLAIRTNSGEWELTPAGDEYAEQLPKAIWSDI